MTTYTKEDIIAFRQEHINPMLPISYSPDTFKVVRAEGQYFYDENGKEYLDCINNVAHVGHGNQHVIDIATKQMKNLFTNSRFLHDELVHISKLMFSKLHPDLTVLTFVNSGSEANDLAMQMAKIHTKKNKMMCLADAYHGTSELAMSVSPYKWIDKKNISQYKKNTLIAETGCTFRGQFHILEDAIQSKLYANNIEKQIIKGGNVAGFIAESMQSCAGQVIPSQSYFKEVYSVLKKHGVVTIADEVQTGFGRLGEKFWAYDYYGVKPDIVTFGKAMGNGFPVAAVACTREISDSFKRRDLEYFNTYGGNPVACAVSRAVLEEIQNKKLQESAINIGNWVNKEFRQLQNDFECVGDVRGLGFFQGLDIVKCKQLREGDSEKASRIKGLAKNEGVLISVDGVHKNIIKFKPPMVFTQKNAETLISVLRKILKTLK